MTGHHRLCSRLDRGPEGLERGPELAWGCSAGNAGIVGASHVLPLAEPGALMSFAGPRVVAQTTREKLPDDFGLAESNYRFGHVDSVVPRGELRPTLARLLRLFGADA